MPTQLQAATPWIVIDTCPNHAPHTAASLLEEVDAYSCMRLFLTFVVI